MEEEILMRKLLCFAFFMILMMISTGCVNNNNKKEGIPNYKEGQIKDFIFNLHPDKIEIIDLNDTFNITIEMISKANCTITYLVEWISVPGENLMFRLDVESDVYAHCIYHSEIWPDAFEKRIFHPNDSVSFNFSFSLNLFQIVDNGSHLSIGINEEDFEEGRLYFFAFHGYEVNSSDVIIKKKGELL